MRNSAWRSRAVPGSPPIREFVRADEAGIGYTVLGGKGLPKSVVSHCNGEIARILALADVKRRMAREGFDPFDVSPQKLHVLLKRQGNTRHAVVKKANINAEAGRA